MVGKKIGLFCNMGGGWVVLLKLTKTQFIRNSIQVVVLLWLLVAPYINLFRLDITYRMFYLFGKGHPFSDAMLFFYAFMGW